MATTTDVREHWLEVARSLAPAVSAQAAAVERAGTLTAEVVELLRRAELFWILVPTDLGGAGVPLADGLRVIEEISRADGSVGWSLMANMTGAMAACAYVTPRVVEEIFAQDRPVFAGMLSPRGSAVAADDGGYVLNGRYGFGSGISHADYVGGGAFVRHDGKVESLPNGAPHLRVFFLPREAAVLRGNWDVGGLLGTGSFDYEFIDEHVDPAFGFMLPDPVTVRPDPSFQLGLPVVGSVGHGAVALGIAVRALEEIATLAATKRRPGMPGIIEQPLFLHGFAQQEATLQAARALFFGGLEQMVDAVGRGASVTNVMRQRGRQAVTYATTVASDVVKWAYTWGGSDALRNPSPLGRCLRDMSAATQHTFVDPNSMVNAGAELVVDWQRGG